MNKTNIRNATPDEPVSVSDSQSKKSSITGNSFPEVKTTTPKTSKQQIRAEYLDEGDREKVDALTGKEWTYLIRKTLLERQERDERRRTVWTLLRDILDVTAAAATIVALGFTAFQFAIGNWQFARSGPVYSWFLLDDLAVSPDGAALTAVISNTGRTPDTIVAIKRGTRAPETMHVCFPTFDEQGRLDPGHPVTAGDTSARLDAGESRIAILMTSPGDGGSFEITDDLTVYAASGMTYKAERVDSDRPVAQEVKDHYGYPGLEEARRQCAAVIARTGSVQ